MNIAEKLRFADDLKSKIEELSPQRNWDDAFYEKVKIDFTYTSNKLEGNTLTYGQTIQLLRDFITPKNASPGELLDMINHQKILDIVFSNYKSHNLTEENIRTLPKGIKAHRYTELCIFLPANWPLESEPYQTIEETFKDENNYWPLRWLKKLARFPHEYNTWIGRGHTIPNGEAAEPFAARPNTRKKKGLFGLW